MIVAKPSSCLQGSECRRLKLCHRGSIKFDVPSVWLDYSRQRRTWWPLHLHARRRLRHARLLRPHSEVRRRQRHPRAQRVLGAVGRHNILQPHNRDEPPPVCALHAYALRRCPCVQDEKRVCIVCAILRALQLSSKITGSWVNGRLGRLSVGFVFVSASGPGIVSVLLRLRSYVQLWLIIIRLRCRFRTLLPHAWTRRPKRLPTPPSWVTPRCSSSLDRRPMQQTLLACLIRAPPRLPQGRLLGVRLCAPCTSRGRRPVHMPVAT